MAASASWRGRRAAGSDVSVCVTVKQAINPAATSHHINHQKGRSDGREGGWREGMVAEAADGGGSASALSLSLLS